MPLLRTLSENQRKLRIQRKTFDNMGKEKKEVNEKEKEHHNNNKVEEVIIKKETDIVDIEEADELKIDETIGHDESMSHEGTIGHDESDTIAHDESEVEKNRGYLASRVRIRKKKKIHLQL